MRCRDSRTAKRRGIIAYLSTTKDKQSGVVYITVYHPYLVSTIVFYHPYLVPYFLMFYFSYIFNAFYLVLFTLLISYQQVDAWAVV